jgi:alpha-mannosidase
VRLDIDNGAENHRLRVRFPIGAGNAATAGAAFGFERRDPVEVTPADHAAELPPQTAPAQRYVAAGDRDRGLALLVPGFVEYEWSARRELTLTLLRSVGELSRGEIAARPGHAGWPMATPDAQEPGHHRIEFGFTPLGEDQSTDVASLERLWEDTFLPPQATFIRHFTGDASGLRSVGVSLEGQGLVFTACKTAENGGGTILRCYNTEPATVDGCWRLGSRISTATLVRADETPVESLVMVDPGVVRFAAGPRAIVSILVVT